MDEVMKALRELAVKLGTTVEELAPHVVAHTQVEGIAAICVAVLALGVLCLAGHYAVKKFKVLHVEADKGSGYYDGCWVVAQIIVYGILTATLVIVSIIVANNLPAAIEPIGETVKSLL